MKNIYLFLFFYCFVLQQTFAQVWTPQKVGIPLNVQMFNISAPDTKTVWASGFNGTFSGSTWTYRDSNTTVARSIDGGLTWEQSTINAGTRGSITSLFALDDKTTWATCLNNGVGGKVFKTTDGGNNWKQQTSATFSTGSYANWIYFWNVNEGVCMGDPTNNGGFEIFRTTDGGDNWARVAASNIPVPRSIEIGFNDMYQVSGDTIWFGTSKGRIYRSVNRGQNWQAYESPYLSVNVIAFSKNHGLGICFENYYLTGCSMALTTNGGVTWLTPVYKPFNDKTVFDATYLPESDYIVVTTRTNNATGPFNTYLSRDKGVTWTEIDNQAPIIKVKFFNSRVGYGGGHKNSATTPSTIYRYTGSALTGLLTPSVLEANIDMSPNPTADQLNILMTYKEPSNFRLNINNLLGDLVYFEDFKDVSSINKSLNIKQLPSGTYILTIANPTGSLSRKFVKTE